MLTPCDQLDLALRPCQLLHDFYGSKLRELDPRTGWIKTSTQLYFSMRSTAPLLRFAAAEAALRCSEYTDFISWASEHAQEECDHAEWFLNDLASVGVTRSALESTCPEDDLLNLVGSQFALVSCTHPFAVLGYFYAMECHPRDRSAIEGIPAQLGLPDEAFRTILYHATADLKHQIEIRRLINKYVTSAFLFHVVLTGGAKSLTSWTRLFVKYAHEAGLATTPVELQASA